MIAQVTSEIPPLTPNFEFLQAFDLSLGDTHALAAPLTVVLNYDESRLDPNLPAADQLQAALRDGATGRWMVIPSEVDETAHTLRFTTDHLSIVALLLLKDADATCMTPHFTIRYNNDSVFNVTGNIQFRPPRNLCGNSEAPIFIQAVADFLESAYEGYESEGFHFAETAIEVVSGYIPEAFYLSADSQFDTLTGQIVINTDTWGDPRLLRHECAHELFHYWQYYRLNSSNTYLGNEWWMDATADYAADKVAWTGTAYGPTNAMGLNIRPSYLRVGLRSTNDFHPYSTSHFVSYLVNETYGYPTFYDLWDDTDNTHSSLNDLKESLQKRVNKTLSEVYADFAEYMLFNSSSKLPLGGQVWGTPATQYLTEYTKKYGEVDLDARDVLGTASTLWDIQVDQPYFMSLEWTNENGGSVYVFFDDQENERDGSISRYRLYPRKTAYFPLTPGRVVYVLMINPDIKMTDFYLKLNLSEIEMYTVSFQYDPADPKCAENLAWGTGFFFMRLKDDQASLFYDSSLDDYNWREGAEHTIVASGDGKIYGGKLVGNLTSSDQIMLAGGEAIGKVSIEATFSLSLNPDVPFLWQGDAQGSGSVDLPATRDFKGYTCLGTVTGISVYPQIYFPIRR